MQSTESIDTLFGTRGRVAVLRVLAHVAVPLSIRQISVQAGLNHASAAATLDALVESGAVATTTAGRSRVHWLERRNLWVREVVLPAFAAEDRMAERVVEVLRTAVPEDVVSAVLFGSHARGEQTRASDIDLLIVAEDRAALDRALTVLDTAAQDLRATLGAPVSVLGYTLTEALVLLTRGDSVMDGVVRDGITLRGRPPIHWGTDDGDTKD